MKSQQKKINSTEPSFERGAAILEFALVAGIFFVTMLALFDFSRYFALQAIITRGAQNGLELAKVIDGLRIDPFALDLDCRQFAADPAQFANCQVENYQRLVDARAAVIARATDLPLNTFASAPGTGGNFELNHFLISDPATPLGGNINFVHPDLSAIVIRPGEAATNTTSNYQVEHPQICPPSGGSCGNEKRRRNANESLNGLLRTFPIIVEVTATIEPLFPFFPPMPVVGRAVGYREVNTGSVSGELPLLLACQDPPPCNGPNQVLTPACTCACTLQCPPYADGHWSVIPGGYRRVPDPTCTFCMCDDSQNYCNGGMQGKEASPGVCQCGCYAQTADPNDDIPSTSQECKELNGDFAGTSLWEFYSYGCNCRCPWYLASECLARGEGYVQSACSCKKCDDYTDPACGAVCPVALLQTKCLAEDPPKQHDPVTCSCVDNCANPPPCTHGTLINCNTCNCPVCPSPKVRDNTGGDCGLCICGPATEVGLGCDPESAKPNPNYDNCKCETPGGGPAS